MHRNRRGLSLIELMVYLGLFGIFINVVTIALSNSSQCSRRVRRQVAALTWTARALEQFKADVRSAKRATLEANKAVAAGPQRLRLAGADGAVITYELANGALIRRAANADGVATRRFPPKVVSVQFGLDASSPMQVVTLTLQLPPTDRRMSKGYVMCATAAIRCPKQTKAHP